MKVFVVAIAFGVASIFSVYAHAVSGKYVTKGYAAKNPRTTVVEQKAKK